MRRWVAHTISQVSALTGEGHKMFKDLISRIGRRLTPRRVSSPDLAVNVTPGVYVEEVPSGSRVIPAAELAAAALVGLTAQGPTGSATAVGSMAEFTQLFGGGSPGPLPDAVQAFFDNGGRRLYVLRVTSMPATAAQATTTLAALDGLLDLGLLALPGLTVPEVLNAAAHYCQGRRQLLLLVDGPPAALAPAQIGGFAQSLAASDHVALYHPWLQLAAGASSVPPSGAVAGLLAKRELDGRIWKAAAGPDARLVGFSAPDVMWTDADIATLVGQQVNPIRTLSAGEVVVWGGRTLSDDAQFRYVSVRRYCSYLEASIARGTRWAVFEPNDAPLWSQLQASVSDFLSGQWRAGALQGSKPDDAFFVRCDRSTMTQQDLDDGRLVVQIGVAPVRPAEFIVLRIVQQMAG
jgi:phage tail sheath protein FI